MSDDQGGAVSEKESKAEFRERQQREAEEQGLGPNSVPESRTPAFSEVPNTDSDITKRQREAGLVDGPDVEPMDKAAYDRANSDAQKKKAEKGERYEALALADPIRVTDESSPYFGQKGAITRLIFDDDTLAKRQGQPSQRFLEPIELEAHSVGGPVGDQIMMLTPDQVEKIDLKVWISS